MGELTIAENHPSCIEHKNKYNYKKLLKTKITPKNSKNQITTKNKKQKTKKGKKK